VHCGVGVGEGGPAVGVGSATQSHPPAGFSSHCPRNAGISGPLQTFPAGHASGTTHGPPQGRLLHCGVDVGDGVGSTGTHSHAPAALISHCPANTGISGPLHTPVVGQGSGETAGMHGPPHVAPVHCGVGVGPGVGVIGTHSHAPDVLISHCPMKTGQAAPSGQGLGTTHVPEQGTLLHWGVGVGPGVGSIGTQAHEPAAFNSHCPTAMGQVAPSGHSVGIKHVPPQGRLLH
jgi:hypothetical protein